MYRIKYDAPNNTIKEQIIRAQFFPALTLYKMNHVIEIMIKNNSVVEINCRVGKGVPILL